jgi:ectoine hydroxylase
VPLSAEQLRAYQRDGFVLVEKVLGGRALDFLRAELPKVLAEESPRRVLEADSVTVRSVYGCHLVSEVFASLVRHPLLLEPARQLVGGEVYLYQHRINAKRALTGDVWRWHQDLIYWTKDDGLPSDAAVTVALLIDNASSENAPILAIPGSHRMGLLQTGPPPAPAEGPSWQASLVADLKYSIPAKTCEALTTRHGIRELTGPPGSLVIFHPALVHSSRVNRSPDDRRILFHTYSRVDNVPSIMGERRPDFLVGRDTAPITPRLDPRFAS